MAIIDASSQLSLMNRSTHNRFEMNAGYDIRTLEDERTENFLSTRAIDTTLWAGKHALAIGLYTRHATGLYNAISNQTSKLGINLPTNADNKTRFGVFGLNKYNDLGFQIGMAITGDVSNPLNSIIGMGMGALGTGVEGFLNVDSSSQALSNKGFNVGTTISGITTALYAANLVSEMVVGYTKNRVQRHNNTLATRTLDGAAFITSLRTHSRNRLSSEDMANYAELARSLQQNISFNQNPAKNYLNQITSRNN